MSADIRECCVRSCSVLIAIDRIMCEWHWRRVPPPIRDRIITTRGRKRDAAIQDALDALRVAR